MDTETQHCEACGRPSSKPLCLRCEQIADHVAEAITKAILVAEDRTEKAVTVARRKLERIWALVCVLCYLSGAIEGFTGKTIIEWVISWVF